MEREWVWCKITHLPSILFINVASFFEMLPAYCNCLFLFSSFLIFFLFLTFFLFFLFIVPRWLALFFFLFFFFFHIKCNFLFYLLLLVYLLDVLLVVLVCKFVIIKNFNFYKLFDGDPQQVIFVPLKPEVFSLLIFQATSLLKNLFSMYKGYKSKFIQITFYIFPLSYSTKQKRRVFYLSTSPLPQPNTRRKN